MSSNVIPLIQVSVFSNMKWMSYVRLFYLSLFCIKRQAIAKEYMGKDFRTSHLDRIILFNWKRTLIVYSFAKEQTFQENANMQFVRNAMRNIQKPRRDQEVVFQVKRSWWCLVIMSYAICSYVLTFGGVPKIILNKISGQSVSRAVLSVRECSL